MKAFLIDTDDHFSVVLKLSDTEEQFISLESAVELYGSLTGIIEIAMKGGWHLMKRRDKCKCGRIIVWNPNGSLDNGVECKFCGTEYYIDSDSILIHWLVERLDAGQPWKTEAR